MSQKTLVLAGGGLFLAVLTAGMYFVLHSRQLAPTPLPTPTPPASTALTEPDARILAEASCIKGGEALGPGTRNEGTRTWWFDANLNATREGCNPACVVSDDTRTAELNWRCTGLIPPDEGGGVEPAPSPTPEPAPEPVGCPADAKLCPDGSAVGRIGPNCEFAPCPDVVPLGRITGSIHTGPTCPVMRIDDPTCEDKPYQAMVQVVRIASPESAPVAQVMSGADGSFSVSVPVGSYTVSVLTPAIFPRCGTVDVFVDSSEPASVDISCDTGIR